MQLLFIIGLSLHILAATFWAGATFTLARTNGEGAEKLLRPQMGAAVLAALTGIYLWSQLHDGRFETPEKILAFGILCAFIAAGVQSAMVGRAVRNLGNRAIDEPTARARIAMAQRIAGGLLAVTIICMASARYL
jgi:hypothetical protein